MLPWSLRFAASMLLLGSSKALAGLLRGFANGPPSGLQPASLPGTDAERAAKLEGMKVDITQKAGPDGRLFGSVTTADIADAVTKAGIETKKAEIRMPAGPLKHIGEFPIVVHLHADVEANVVVHVVAEQ